jgi:hypothetical protein
MNVYSLFAVPAVLALVSIAAAAFALHLDFASGAFRFQRAFVASIVSLALALFGYVTIHISASETVNGVVRWSLNSKWFFLPALALGVFALGATLWKRSKTSELCEAAATKH